MVIFEQIKSFWIGVGTGIILVIFVAMIWAMKNNDDNEQF